MRREVMAGIVAAAVLAGGGVGYVLTLGGDDPSSVVAIDETPTPAPSPTSPTPSPTPSPAPSPTPKPTTVAPTTVRPTPKQPVAYVVADNTSKVDAKVTVNALAFVVEAGDTRRVEVAPSKDGNDVISVASTKYPRCGRTDVRGLVAGKTYRVVIKASADCTVDGKQVLVPTFEVYE